MSFISPWLLWVLFAAFIPIIIHLINKWRHKSVHWAAMEFLLRAAKETRGKKKLLHYLILSLRVLALATLITAFARPLLSSFFGWGSSKLNEVLLILDRSASMGTRPDKTNSLQDAVPPMINSAFKQLEQCHLSLLDSTTGKVYQIPSPETLSDLSLSKTTDSGADIPALLQKAISYLEESGSGETEIWIASDMQSSSWKETSPLWSGIRQRIAALPSPPAIRIMALRDRPKNNRGIRVKQTQVLHDKLILDLEILRQGFDPNQQEQIPMQISVDNTATASTLQLAGESTTIRKEIPLSQGQDSGFGFVTIPHDDFANDDISFFTFAPRPQSNILIYGPSGDMGKTLSLISAPPGLPDKKATIHNSLKTAQAKLSAQSLVIWYGPPPHSEMVKTLQSFIEKGGTVLFLPDDTAHNTSQHPFLGVSWGETETASHEQYYHLTTWDRQKGILHDGADKKSIPANRLRAIRRKPLQGNYKTLASWDDGSCALAQVRQGAGVALFLGTLPKYSWSNLADGHLLLPLVQRLANRGAERFSSSFLHRVNDPTLPQSATESPVRMDNANGSHPTGTPIDTAGVYRLGTQTYAVNRPWAEDDPDQITHEKVSLLLPGAEITSMQHATSQPTLVQESWQLFLFISLAGLLLEAFLSLPGQTTKSLPRTPQS